MKIYVDKNALQDYTTKLIAKEKTIFATKNEVGSPLVASTVAGMTDHDKIYVYVGSETGYTSGNWYYWNGTAWTSGGIYNSEGFVLDDTLTSATLPAQAKAVGDKVNQLSEDVNAKYSILNGHNTILNTQRSFRVKATTNTAPSWQIDPASGLAKQNSDYTIKKYAVTEGDIFRVVSDSAFQFQDSSNVSSLNTDSRIGPTYGVFDGYVQVPTGATYLMVSTLKTGGLGNVYTTDMSEYLPWWNVSNGGIAINGYSIVVNANGFSFYHGGFVYYIAPTDQSTVTTFTETPGNATKILMLDTTKLTNPGARHNPSDVLSVYTVSSSVINVPWTSIPVALWHKNYWDFVGVFRYFKTELTKNLNISGIFAENQLIAHKGGNSGTNNTLPNFERAISDGYKVVEMDVRFTKDDVAILWHDATFTVNGVTYTIADETCSDLKAAFPAFTTLSDALLLCKKNNIIADIDFTKEYSNAQSDILFSVISSLGMFGRCFISCYSSVARYLLTKSRALCFCISGVYSSNDIASIKDVAQQASVCMCSTLYTELTQALVDEMHQNGMLSKPFTPETVSDIKNLFDLGCDMIITTTVKPSDL